MFSANESPGCVLFKYIPYMLGHSVYLDSGGTCLHAFVLDDPAMWRHDPPSTASKLAHLIFIILTLFFVQMKALDVFYQNIHHMYLAIVYI